MHTLLKPAAINWRLFLELISIVFLLVPSTLSSPEQPGIALPGCNWTCGSIIIPYPFGLGPGCYLSAPYALICEREELRLANSTAFQWDGEPLMVKNITWEPEKKIYVRSVLQNVGAPGTSPISFSRLDLRGSPYRVSGEDNILLVQACRGSVQVRIKNDTIVAGCASVCRSLSDGMTGCYGEGCCTANIPFPLDYLEMYYLTLDVVEKTTEGNTVVIIDRALVADKAFNIGLKNLEPSSQAVLEWMVAGSPFDPDSNANSNCTPQTISDGIVVDYSCKCKEEFHQGNPYLPNGCHVVEACKRCPKTCKIGKDGSFGCGSTPLSEKQKLAIGLGLAPIFFLLCYFLLLALGKEMKTRRGAKNFKRNGGMLLRQKMCSNESLLQHIRLFNRTEMEKATDHFNKDRILGVGGQGTVYKGMLVDGTIVAVKKFITEGETQVERLISEVVILCQINHRNVVKLLGCCLETEAPLLVYEFIPNGTLAQHIHHPNEDFFITWKMRLQIAADTAGAVAYLHSSSSTPVFHRDIKSSNILLDEKYRPKLSDFGSSRTLHTDQTHLSTLVQGTFGYLDPEYFMSSKFTEKSDVFSFGIVLLELVTGQKPISPMRFAENRCLALEFLHLMENSRFFEILDPRVVQEGSKEELTAVASLIKQCLNMNGKQRPTMKEVAMMLEGVRSPHLLFSARQGFQANELYTEISIEEGPTSPTTISP